MALPEGYFTDLSSSEDEGLSFPDDSPKKNFIPIDESKLHPGIQLINAILDRKLDEIQKIIDEGVDVNFNNNSSGWTPLMYASSLGISEYVRLLLKNGALPNDHVKLTTPLMCLCNSTSFDEDELLKCFNLLLDAGASIDVCDENKITPLMYATSKGHIPLVARLLELGLDLEMKDNDGWTAINFAVNSGDINMVQMLKDAGSNLSVIDSKGRSLYDLAVSKSYQVIAEIVNPQKKTLTDDLQLQLLQSRNIFKFDSVLYDMPNYSIKDFNGFVDDSIKTIVAAGLNNLVDLFMEKKIGYGQFLILQEKDWKEIGVKMSFDRKKLTIFSKKVIQKKWSQKAFIKQVNEKFSLFKLVECVSNAIRVVHILIATCYVCRRELTETNFKYNKDIRVLLNQCLYELFLLKTIIKKVNNNVEIIDKIKPADFIV